ncbi:transmembrane protein, putative [Medicago truncatula]|uniref:Transmembrane protein, putative n=1 Tax=Medicago truncatula TaxID=3880 RepID=G7JH65_MEDTR|nr:transmembrane protein, putative [Medicago truncatula]
MWIDDVAAVKVDFVVGLVVVCCKGGFVKVTSIVVAAKVVVVVSIVCFSKVFGGGLGTTFVFLCILLLYDTLC